LIFPSRAPNKTLTCFKTLPHHHLQLQSCCHRSHKLLTCNISRSIVLPCKLLIKETTCPWSWHATTFFVAIRLPQKHNKMLTTGAYDGFVDPRKREKAQRCTYQHVRIHDQPQDWIFLDGLSGDRFPNSSLFTPHLNTYLQRPTLVRQQATRPYQQLFVVKARYDGSRDSIFLIMHGHPCNNGNIVSARCSRYSTSNYRGSLAL
jgi:hypothetical protein